MHLFLDIVHKIRTAIEILVVNREMLVVNREIGQDFDFCYL